MSIAAMRQAVDYLRLARDYGIALGVGNTSITDAINDLLKAIEAQEQCEPVAWRWSERGFWFGWTTDFTHHDKALRLNCPVEYAYTHPAPIPAGWQLVPVEPTDEMKVAGSDALGVYHCGSPSDIYKAMLQAAPKPGENS